MSVLDSPSQDLAHQTTINLATPSKTLRDRLLDNHNGWVELDAIAVVRKEGTCGGKVWQVWEFAASPCLTHVGQDNELRVAACNMRVH